MNKIQSKNYLTTFEISKILEVNLTTVQNWIKEGKLKAFATPGGHRRVRKDDLYSFARHYNLPIPKELQESKSVILIVDDEQRVREMLKEVFEKSEIGSSLELYTASSGIEALLFIGDKKPDLVILDIFMPGMDGFKVCRAIKGKNETKDISIIAITGQAVEGTRGRILECGADDFFTKPLDVAALLEASLQHLGISATP